MLVAQRVNYSITCVLLLISLAQCRQRESELSPQIASLVGTWRLVAPDSTYKTILTIELDTANPPHDITPLLANGQSAINAYTLRLFAAIDGTMSSESWSTTEIAGAQTAMAFEQTYFRNLRAVVRYQMTPENRLYLYHGGSQPRVLTYEKVR